MSEVKDPTFHQRVAEIQAKLKAPKSQYNAFGKYAYRSCEDILEGLKPILNGLVLTISDEIIMVGERVYVQATAKITDGAQWIENKALAREPISKKGMDESQITGTASSYARKYALNGLFCIDDTKDADSQDNREKPKTNGERFSGNNGGGHPGDYVINFGKYNGKSLKDLNREDLVSYCTYLKSNNENPDGKMKELLEKAREYLRAS